MSAPNPSTFVSGVGAVSADNFNTFPQVVYNLAQLRTFTGVAYSLAVVLGGTAPNDSGQAFYFYQPTGTFTNNNTTVIVPYGALTGAWLQLAFLPAYATATVPNHATLASLPSTFAPRVLCLGCNSAGDSPQILYLGSAAAPTVNTVTGGGDNFSQIPASDGGSWLATAETLLYATPQCAGATGNGSTDDTAAIKNYVTAMGQTEMFFPPGDYLISTSTPGASIFASTVPLKVRGVNTGAGPGPAAQENGGQTRFLINSSNCTVFNVTSLYPSIFRDFAVLALPAARPMTGGAGIFLQGPPGSTCANSRIQNVAFSNVYSPIIFLRPSWPEVSNCYFDTWGNSALYMTTTNTNEGSGGFIHHNYFAGLQSTTTAPIYSEVGYTIVAENEILGGPTGVDFNIKNFPAGFIKIVDNTIEDFLTYGVYIASGDGTLVSMAMVQNNEFSNFTANVTASVFIADNTTTPAWINDVTVSGNTSRNTTAAGARHIWIGAGKNVTVALNTLDELSANACYGVTVGGAATSAGLVAPIQVLDNTMIGISAANRYNFYATGLAVLRDLSGVTVAQLPTGVRAGSQVFATDGTPGSSPLTGGSTGTQGFYQNSAWKGL